MQVGVTGDDCDVELSYHEVNEGLCTQRITASSKQGQIKTYRAVSMATYTGFDVFI